ncbi:MAG: energy transducer TonB [Bryobacteraceae bacterium]
MPQVTMALLAGILGASVLPAQSATAVIRSRPMPSPQVIENLELQVLQNPEDLQARFSLLQFYWDTAPSASRVDSGRRSARLEHILYLVEHHPEATMSGFKLAYVYRANGPYANAADHDEVRDQWIESAQSHPRDNAVALNAVKFLEVEDRDDAEQVLRRAMAADAGNREMAANLGFLYAMEILGNDPDLVQHAQNELEQSFNAIVLAAAGTALPNLAVHGSGGRIVDEKIFDLANGLSARARQLAPDDPDIQGPMPLIKYFVAGQDGRGASPPSPQPASAPSRIKVGENVQAMNLIRKTQPQYPEAARTAGITGDVRLSVIIGRDGTVQNVQLISGHPLLVQAAVEAVENWLYKPTLLNGAPVEVATTVTVSFPPN